jgi:hypothetical protein
LDEQGNEIIHTKGASHKYVDPTDAKTAATEFAVPVGLLMTPVIVPAIKNTSTPVVMNLSVRATLTLTFKNITTPPVPLSFKSLPVPVIALPSVLVLFGAENFGGHVLACVPNNAGIQQAGNIVPLDTLDQLKGALETIRNSLQNIKDLLMVAGWLTGLDSVTDVLSVLDKNPQLAIAGDDNSINLEDYDLERIAGIWYDWDDDPSSMIFVAAPGGSVTCLFPWNLGDVNRAYWNYGGEIQLNTDLDLSVSVKTLDTNHPKPLNVVNGQNSQTKLIIVEGNDDGFDDIMHKIQF